MKERNTIKIDTINNKLNKHKNGDVSIGKRVENIIPTCSDGMKGAMLKVGLCKTHTFLCKSVKWVCLPVHWNLTARNHGWAPSHTVRCSSKAYNLLDKPFSYPRNTQWTIPWQHHNSTLKGLVKHNRFTIHCQFDSWGAWLDFNGRVQDRPVKNFSSPVWLLVTAVCYISS